MRENNMLTRRITVDMLHNALNLVTYHFGPVLEEPELPCDWTRLCGNSYCRFPKYHRKGEPVGLTAHVLVELGMPMQLLRDLDCEYEVGEVLHPGVKIGRSRNAALARVDKPGVALLTYLQDHQKVGWDWQRIALQAFRPSWMIRRLDERRRPWLY